MFFLLKKRRDLLKNDSPINEAISYVKVDKIVTINIY